VAYDVVGAPTRAAVSFAEKQGVALHEIYFLQTAKGEYLAAKNVKRGRAPNTFWRTFSRASSTTFTGRRP